MERDPSGRWSAAERRTLAVPFDLDELRCDDFIVPSGMVHRRSVVDEVGRFDECLAVSDDWDWLLRAAVSTRFARWPRAVVTVRIWPDGSNRSARFDTERLAALAEIERRHGTPPLEPKTFWEVAEKHLPPPAPDPLIQIAAAYQHSAILKTLIELELPTRLAEGPRSRDAIAAELSLDPLAAQRFLDAGVALGLLERSGDRYANAPVTRRYLVRGASTDLSELLLRHVRRAPSSGWATLASRLSSWRGATAERMRVEGDARADVDAQHRLSLLVGEALAGALDLGASRRLLDLGGGTGAMSIALCRRYSELSAVILELPAIASLAREHVAESGLEHRITVEEGDFVVGPLPSGGDVALLANVLSMLSVTGTRSVLARVFDALPAGGTIAISGWMLDDDEHGPLTATLFSLEDIVHGAPDVERSAATYLEWLTEAGFEPVDRVRYFDPTVVVTGQEARSDVLGRRGVRARVQRTIEKRRTSVTPLASITDR